MYPYTYDIVATLLYFVISKAEEIYEDEQHWEWSLVQGYTGWENIIPICGDLIFNVANISYNKVYELFKTKPIIEVELSQLEGGRVIEPSQILRNTGDTLDPELSVDKLDIIIEKEWDLIPVLEVI